MTEQHGQEERRIVAREELGPLLGAGQQAEVFAWRPGRVVKLYRLRDHWPQARREMRNTRLAGRQGFPAPEVFEILEIDGRPGLVLERLDGEPLADLLFRQPWRIPELARAAAELQARMHDLDGGALPCQKQLWTERLRESRVLTPAERQAMLGKLEALPAGTSLCHGDLTPDNLLLTGTGLRVIDWSRANRGQPATDLANSLNEIHPTAATRHDPWRLGRRRAFLPLVAVACGLYRSLFLRHYRRLRPVSRRELASWISLAAAVHLDSARPELVRRLYRTAVGKEMRSSREAALGTRLSLK